MSPPDSLPILRAVEQPLPRLFLFREHRYEEQSPDDWARLMALGQSIDPGSPKSSKLFWKLSSRNVNLYAPSNEDLALLRDAEARKALAISLVDDVYDLWKCAHVKFLDTHA